MSIIHVVTYHVGGFAREDAPVTKVAGAFTSEPVASIIAKCVGGTLHTVEVDVVQPGYRKTAEAYGLNLDQYAVPAAEHSVKASK